MKGKITYTVTGAALALATIAGASAMQAHDTKATPPKGGDEMQPEMMQPGPMHTKLAKYVGEWTTMTKMSIPGQTAPPDETKGTSKITSKLGGRFFMEEDSGTMMGMPFESIHYTGYNTATKQYEANWTYTHSTSMMSMTGNTTDDGKTISWVAAFKEGEKPTTLKVTTKFIDDDHFSVTLSGDEATMETNYTRRK